MSTPGNPLATTRSGHTATLLSNGKVLVAGGFSGDFRTNGAALASADLYDPATKIWSPAGSLAKARSGHTASLLPNGKVLVVGGFGGDYLTSAELYNPATNTWTATGALGGAHGGHTATLLANGKVLVAGGSSTGLLFANAELYNPATNTWSAAGSLNVGRFSHSATLLTNGKVLLVGGYNNGASNVGISVELYDPTLNTWSLGPELLPHGSFGHTATLLPNGKVLIAGGNYSNFPVPANQLYDAATNTWSEAGPHNSGRWNHTATLLPNSKVLLIGGRTGVSNAIASAEFYDPSVGVWSDGGTLTVPRSQPTTTLLLNGKPLVVGGYSPFTNDVSESAELFNPTSNSWTVMASLKTGRYSHAATQLHNGKVLITAGIGSTGYLKSAELYDPIANAWSFTALLTMARYGHTVTTLPNGKVLVVGGAANNPLASAELFDRITNTWTPAESLTTARLHHTATLLPSGKVLIAGGENNIDPVTSAELYDPANNSWSSAGNGIGYSHTATLLPNGKVLIAGGTLDSNNYSSTAELFEINQLPDVSRRPNLSSLTTALLYKTAPVFTGTGFRPNLEASGGGAHNSASNFPLLQVMRLDNGQTTWLPVDPNAPFSDTKFTSTSTALEGFPFGAVSIRAFVNGISSDAVLTTYGPTVATAPTNIVATPGPGKVTVTFSPPANSATSAISVYTATCSAAGKASHSSTGSGSPIMVRGLLGGVNYTCALAASNSVGTGIASAGVMVTPQRGRNMVPMLQLLLD
ncbi:MAG: kelch repeat-containing protein [Pseudomonadota bacterium]